MNIIASAIRFIVRVVAATPAAIQHHPAIAGVAIAAGVAAAAAFARLMYRATAA